MNLIDCLTKEEKSTIKLVTLYKNDILFHETDYCDSVGIVLEGIIKISSIGFNGEEIIFNTLLPNDVFGNNLIFSSFPYHKGNIVAKSNIVKLCLIDKVSLIKILKNNEEFLIEYLRKQSDFSKELNNHVKVLSFKSAKERLIYYLYSYGGRVKIHSVSSLANQLGLTREVTSRLISAEIKKGSIERKNNELRLLVIE